MNTAQLDTLRLGPAVAQWSVWTTTARIVTTDPDTTEAAQRLVQGLLDDVGRAASRFREDSEVSRLARMNGRQMPVSPLLAELVTVALRAAADTDGAVDPTLGARLAELGYDRDLADVTDRSSVPGTSPAAASPSAGGSSAGGVRGGAVTVRRRPGWKDVHLDGSTLTVPAGMLLDLGATTKAWAADRGAQLVAAEFGGGALVSLGGDLRVAGTDPAHGWTILVQDGLEQPSSTIALQGARAVATSSTLHRSWRRGSVRMHHILDPLTARPSAEVWRTVSVAAPTCVQANVLTTAALVRSESAPQLLRASGFPSRLVHTDGSVITLNGWPTP